MNCSAHPQAATRHRDEHGYTAVDMTLTVAILAILAFASISWVGDVVEGNRAKSAAQQLASALRQARQYAVANHATYSVTLTSGTIAISCTADCPPNAPSEPATSIVNGATTSVPGTPISFGPMGTGDQPGTLDVTYPGAPAWQVRVTGAGGIRACSPACT
jgi:Tfp pilus assembly protein PilE